MFPKKRRLSDKQLMRDFHSRKCLLCNDRATPSHVKTRGSGGPDTDWNIMALCFKHHSEWGQIGWKKFCARYPRFESELIKHGWTTSEERLWNPKLEEV